MDNQYPATSSTPKKEVVDGSPHTNHQPNKRNVDVEKYQSEALRLTSPPSDITSTIRTQSTNATCTASIVSRIRSRPFIEPFTHPLANEPTTKSHLVFFEGPDDPYRPMQWPMHKKILTLLAYSLVASGNALASAIFNTAIPQISLEYNISSTVAVLGTSLFLFGFSIGPFLWAPLSEVYGRKIAILPFYFMSAIFSIATGAAKDVQTIIITRFFAGFFGSAPLTNVGGVISDTFIAEQQALAVIGYSLCITAPPTLGPLIGGTIVKNTTWRWIPYSMGIYMLSTLALAILYCDETYEPILLVRKARKLRVVTHNWALHAKHEEWNVSIAELARKFMVRPWQILFTPIALAMNLYSAFVYGVFYLCLGAVSIIFEEGRGWNSVQGGLPWIAILLGFLLACIINYANQSSYIRHVRLSHDLPVPEARLPPMMIGGPLFTAGCFITGWTGSPKYPWIAPMVGLVLVGAGVLTVVQSALNYLIDTFPQYAASAVAANTFLNNVFASVLPLVVGAMYKNLGVEWATSLVGFISVGMLPIPFVLWACGERLRARGVWSRDSVH